MYVLTRLLATDMNKSRKDYSHSSARALLYLNCPLVLWQFSMAVVSWNENSNTVLPIYFCNAV